MTLTISLDFPKYRPCAAVRQSTTESYRYLDGVQKSENPHLQILPGLANRVDANAVDDSTYGPLSLAGTPAGEGATPW